MAITPANVTNKAEIIPANFFLPLDFESVFGRAAPVEIDLGCGDGSFVVAVATANPGRNFLGIERMAGRVRSACCKIELSRVNNARVLRSELFYAVSQLLPAKSVEVFHLLFPDPWPKRRHAAHRIATKDFFAALAQALVPCGIVRIATDDTEYFREIARVTSGAPVFVSIHAEDAPAAMSTFEKRFRQDGRQIHRLVLRKISEVT